MNILGWVLAVVGAVGLIYGLRMMLKGKKMNTVPFRRPSELAAQGATAADPKGMVSTEGSAQLPPQPLIAPMSGEPCIGYELTIERKWEKHVRTEKGMEKKTGTSKVHGEYRGSFFQIGDGAGSVLVDATTEPDSEYEKSHTSTISVGMMVPGTLTFGQFQMNTPTVLDADTRTTAFVGTEKVLRASPTMYVLGQVASAPQAPQIQGWPQGLALGTPKGIGTGKLIVHHQGRERLLGKTRRNMILGYAIGGALFVGGVPLGLFGPRAKPSANAVASCDSTIVAGELTCEDRMYSADGKDFDFKVAAAGTYAIELRQPNVASPVDGVLTLTDASGKQLATDDGGSADTNARVVFAFEPGAYKLNVRDFAHDTVEGGYGFQLVVSKQAPALPAAVASATPAAVTTTTNAQVAGPHHAGAAPHAGATPAAHGGAKPAPAKPAPKAK